MRTNALGFQKFVSTIRVIRSRYSLDEIMSMHVDISLWNTEINGSVSIVFISIIIP